MASCARSCARFCSRLPFSLVYHGAKPSSSSAIVGGNSVGDVVTCERVIKSRQFRWEKHELLRQNRLDPDMERAARMGTLLVPLEDVYKRETLNCVISRLQRAAIHFNLYTDMYGSVFTPRCTVRIAYSAKAVHHGNIISPTQAAEAPEVGLPSSFLFSTTVRDDDLLTLVLSNPDGHWIDNSMELCHWMVCNIPIHGPITAGHEVLPYCPPLPLRGTGVHRMVFSLYLHSNPLTIPSASSSTSSWVEQRTFNTIKLLSDFPQLQPFTFCFFQSLWDASVQHMFSDTLCTPEPVFDIEKSISRSKLKRMRIKAARANRYKFINPLQLRTAGQTQ